jgi:hypothetical protein
MAWLRDLQEANARPRPPLPHGEFIQESIVNEA